MCGRYAFDDIKEIYEARRILEEISSRLGSGAVERVKTGEVFPGDTAAALIQRGSKPEADVMSWGYPMKDTKRLVINARSETAFISPMFRKSVATRRCLIPCTGFYEWKKTQGGSVKYKIGLEDSEMFYLAGLFDECIIENERSKRFVILTGEADKDIKEIHSRMPLIIKPEKAGEWLSGIHDSFDRFFSEPKKIIALPAV